MVTACSHPPQLTVAESFPEHVGGELNNWLRRRFLVPGRLAKRTGILQGISAHPARKGETAHRSEAIVARLFALYA